VPASTESPLPDSLADDYRMAADLMSRSAEVAVAAVPMLPKELRAVPRTAVVEIMIRTGIISTLGRAASIKDLRKRTPATIAAVVSAGARMLRGWRGSMRSHVAERTESIENDLVAYDKIRRSIRWMAGTTTEGRALVAAAFPNVDGRTADVFASESGHYSATEANVLLSCSSAELARLRDVGALRFEALPSNRRLRARYDAGDVDRLRRQLDDCMPPGAAAARIDVPTYASDQLAQQGRIDLRSEPGVFALRGHQVSAASMAALIVSLTRAARRSPPPADFVPLAAALVARPGEKPWGPVVDALLAGAIPFHAEGDAISLRDARVDPVGVAAPRPARGSVERRSRDARLHPRCMRTACYRLRGDGGGYPVRRHPGREIRRGEGRGPEGTSGASVDDRVRRRGSGVHRTRRCRASSRVPAHRRSPDPWRVVAPSPAGTREGRGHWSRLRLGRRRAPRRDGLSRGRKAPRAACDKVRVPERLDMRAFRDGRRSSAPPHSDNLFRRHTHRSCRAKPRDRHHGRGAHEITRLAIIAGALSSRIDCAPLPWLWADMAKSATDTMQEIIFSAIIDSVVALKEASKGVPNALLRDLNSVHPNTTIADLPAPVQNAIAESVRQAFIRLRKEGYTVADAASVQPPRPPSTPRPPRPGGPAGDSRRRPAPRPGRPPGR
jgi:hypothetical protein